MEKYKPLEDVALHYLKTAFPKEPDEKIESAHEIIVSYIRNIKNFNDTQAEYVKIFSNTSPLERMRAILEVGSTPLPPQPKNFENISRKSNGWTSVEDQRLLHGILKYGVSDWSHIARFVGNSRTRAQCSQRWHRTLNPVICKDTWEKEQDEKLLELVKSHGEHTWSKIAAELKNRTDVQCRYRYQILQRNIKNRDNAAHKTVALYALNAQKAGVHAESQSISQSKSCFNDLSLMKSNDGHGLCTKALPNVILCPKGNETKSPYSTNQHVNENEIVVPKIPSIVIPIKDSSIIKIPDYFVGNLSLSCI